MSDDQHEVELPIRTAWEAGDLQTAATLTLKLYGEAIFNFLVGRTRDPLRAEEAFSMFAEDLWRGLPGFAWRCSMRGWAYALARNAANRQASSPEARPERNLTLSKHEAALQIIAQARSETHVYQRTDAKDRIRALRERLLPDDQTLLVLHVDRRLPWRELAVVMHDVGDQLEGEDLEREAARLRKRFERIKAELKRLAKAQGLIHG